MLIGINGGYFPAICRVCFQVAHRYLLLLIHCYPLFKGSASVEKQTLFKILDAGIDNYFVTQDGGTLVELSEISW